MQIAKHLDFGPVLGCQMAYSPIGKPLMAVICYFVDGLLIDTGANNANAAFRQLTDNLAIDKVVLTHYHEDHSGNVDYLSYTRSLPIFAHPTTVERLRDGFSIRPYEWFMWGKPKKTSLSIIPDSIETEHFTFTHIHTPGHANDHLVYFEENQGWLFSGDMFLSTRIKLFRRDEDLNQTIASLKKLSALDFDTLFCGHNPKIGTGKIAIAEKLQHLEDFKGSVFSLLDKGWTKSRIRRKFSDRESLLAKLITLGDVSFENLLTETVRTFYVERQIDAKQ